MKNSRRNSTITIGYAPADWHIIGIAFYYVFCSVRAEQRTILYLVTLIADHDKHGP